MKSRWTSAAEFYYLRPVCQRTGIASRLGLSLAMFIGFQDHWQYPAGEHDEGDSKICVDHG